MAATNSSSDWSITSKLAVATSTSPAYTSGDVVGGKVNVTTGLRALGGILNGGTIRDVVFHSKSTQTGNYDVIFFDSDPSASTFTDNGALAVNVADGPKIVGVANLTSVVSLGTGSIHQLLGTCIKFALAAQADLYAVVVARSTPTFTSTADGQLSVMIEPY